jgi:hypothetical protein
MAVGGYIVSAPVSIAGADPGVLVKVSVVTATSALGFMPQTPSATILPGSGGTGSGSIGFTGAGLYTIVATQAGSTTSNSVSVNVINAKSTAAPGQGTTSPIVSLPPKVVVSPPASSGILSSISGTGGLISSPPAPVIHPPVPVIHPPAPVVSPTSGLLSSLPGTGGLLSSLPGRLVVSPPAKNVLPPAMAVVPTARVPYSVKGWTGPNATRARVPYSVKGRGMFGTTIYNQAPTGVPYGIDLIPDNGQPVMFGTTTYNQSPAGIPYGIDLIPDNCQPILTARDGMGPMGVPMGRKMTSGDGALVASPRTAPNGRPYGMSDDDDNTQ